MLVSVIVPNHNYAESLDLCLRAILDQSYPDIEVIVVDDCSTDDSVAVAQAVGVRVISTGRNGGCGQARNVGAAHASGEILCFVDSDLAMAKDAVAQAVAILQAEPDVGCVCGIEDPEPLLHDTAVARYRGMQYHYWSISSEGDVTFLFPAMCAIRRSVFDEIGAFNPALRHTEEVDYGYRLSRRYRLRLTSAMRGRHDHDHRLLGLLRKLFHRGRMRIPLYAKARKFATGFETASRAWGSLAALISLPAFVFPAVLGGGWLAVPLAFIAASLYADRGMYAFVVRRRGLRFLLYFAAVHYLVNITIALGVGVGVLQWTVSRTFRETYDATFPQGLPEAA
jgi:glycosyltransferase involved in cell wall biosynthesis